MMNADTLKHLQSIIDAANPQRRIVTAPNEPPHVYYVVNAAGDMEKKYTEQPLPNDTAGDLDTVVRVWQSSPGAEAIWYSRAAVIGLLGKGRVTMPLKESPQLAQLIAWDAARRVNVSQRELVMLLRTTFADCLPAFPNFLDNVRKLRTTKAAEVNSEIGKGKVSLGKSVVAEMSGIDRIPDEIVFRVPVFSAASLLTYADVRACVEPSPEDEQFTLAVIPGQIENAWRAGELAIYAKLLSMIDIDDEDPYPVLHGKP